MNSYGYSYEDMLPLTQDTAQKLFDMDAAVYMLHYDNTEALVMDASEIKNFDGIFGIEKNLASCKTKPTPAAAGQNTTKIKGNGDVKL